MPTDWPEARKRLETYALMIELFGEWNAGSTDRCARYQGCELWASDLSALLSRADRIDALEAEKVAANSELAEYAKTVGNLRTSLDICRQTIADQAAARTDPTMPLLTREVVADLRADAEASYALAETREERVAAHGLSLICEWQERARTTLSPAPSTQEAKP